MQKHGSTLDFIFSKSKVENILLIDSDIEVLGRDAIDFIRKYMNYPNTFGAGFVHGPHSRVLNKKNSYYGERMWIPFTNLNVEKVQEALAAKESFNIVTLFNDFPYNEFLAKRIYKIENKFNLKLKILNLFRKIYGNNKKPSFVLNDTGANIYRYLKETKEYHFFGPSSIVSSLYVSHFDGITRNMLDSSDYTGQSLNDVSEIIKTRLKDVYNFEVKG